MGIGCFHLIIGDPYAKYSDALAREIKAVDNITVAKFIQDVRKVVMKNGDDCDGNWGASFQQYRESLTGPIVVRSVREVTRLDPSSLCDRGYVRRALLTELHLAWPVMEHAESVSVIYNGNIYRLKERGTDIAVSIQGA